MYKSNVNDESSLDSLPLVVDSDFRSYCRSFCRDRASAGAGSWNVECGMRDVGCGMG